MTIRQTLFTLLLSSSLLWSATGGKLAGRVTSADGDPLIGVNIIVEGTNLGAASGQNGEYYILEIPPGKYSVRYSMIGFKTHIIQAVEIQSQFTTTQNVALESTVLEGEEVVVVAERPLFQKDATSKIVVMDSDEITNMAVADFKDVLVTRAGFTEDASGGIHLRGGRTREILYMIDGMVVKDPLIGDFTGTVNQNAIKEMSIISGTFNAEYGEAMSGVVNIITKEGSKNFHGRFEYLSDQINSSPYHKQGAFFSVEDTNYTYVNLRDMLLTTYQNAASGTYPKGLLPLFDLPAKGTNNITLSGPLLGKSNFFLSGYYGATDSPLPHGTNIRQDVELKLTQHPTPKLKISQHLHTSTRLYQSYAHSWKYQPEHQAHTLRTNDRLAINVTNHLSESMFYRFSLSQMKTGTHTGVQDKTPDQYVRPSTDVTVYFYNPKNDTVKYVGDQGIYTDNLTSTQAVKFDLVNQINFRHQIKTGFQYSRHYLDIYTEDEPWEGGANFKDDTTFTPTEASFYIQDKIEYETLILNLGIRYDRLDPNAAMWRDVTRFVVWDSTADAWKQAPVEDVPPRTKWSPRIGFAFPVTDNMVFHFSYGHFFQNPSFDAITYNAQKDISSTLPLVGNPKVKPQKTIAFETGLKQSITPDVGLEITAWTKDIRGLLSTEQIRYLSNQYILYSNTDYASVKGMDLTLTKRPTGYFSGSLAYTLSVAKGNNSNPTAGYFSAYTQEEIPHQEYFLSFDQRHDISANLNIHTPVNYGPQIIGFYPLEQMNVNLLINAGSGLPYTPYVDPTIRVDVNSARKPWTFTADLRLQKSILLKNPQLVLVAEVTNLTDHKNVLFVYSRTGKPFDPGFSGVGTSEDANHNPAHLGPGRAIKLGAYLEW